MRKHLLLLLLVSGLTVISCTEGIRTSAVICETYTPSEQERQTWNILIDKGVESILFTKRYTYDANHYYTEYINSKWMPGGNIYTLSLKDGEVKELIPSLEGGVFGKFDISFDAKCIVFAYKSSRDFGYRLYEVNIDGSNLKQLTFSPDDEVEIVEKYNIAGYHHGTDDLDPCYLPDGGIAFISTRCRFGILCDGPDIFTTTVIYRMDGDGKNITQLSNNSVSENTPCVLPDGRIMYTRWEYVDKGAVAVKCLWAMMPDGSGSSEIYGNDIDFPTTMIMARPILDSPNEYVFTGTPHCPQNGVGTVVRIDMTKDMRTKEPMTYMTPYVDIQTEPGFHFRDSEDEPWRYDGNGYGPLFRETYPLSRSEFIVSHKPEGKIWSDSISYDIFLLNEKGIVSQVYKDDTVSCFNPMPLIKRDVPPILVSKIDEELAKKNLAECIVTDVYQGLTGVERGSVKYIRILEQIPRPWNARRPSMSDEYDQQHVVITKDTHLGLKIQHGIVTVEDDGSARFYVPACKNIIFQLLDSDYMAIQTERTFVGFNAGEIRSCVGCHEPQSQTPINDGRSTPKAMKREAEMPYPQLGEKEAYRALDYARDVQPVWDRNCVNCHNSAEAKAGLNLSGELTTLFNASYESLIPERRKGFHDKGLLGLIIGENHPKTGNVNYLPAKSLGSHTSVLVAMLTPDKVVLSNEKDQERAGRLYEIHDFINLPAEDLLKITNWIDTNCQYYGSYFGNRNITKGNRE